MAMQKNNAFKSVLQIQPFSFHHPACIVEFIASVDDLCK